MSIESTDLPPQTKEAQSSFPKSKLSFKILILAALLVFILLLTFVALYAFKRLPIIKKLPKELTETKKEKKEWPSYLNKDYGFSLEYPIDWKVEIGKIPEITSLNQVVKISNEEGKEIFVIPLSKDLVSKKDQRIFPPRKDLSLIKDVIAADPPKISITAPEGENTVFKNTTRSPEVILVVEAPGSAQMMISDNSQFVGASWEPYSAMKPWTFSTEEGEKKVYVQVKDFNENITEASETFLLDTMPPFGGIAINNRVVGPDIIVTEVYLGAEDNLSGVQDMRVSTKSDLSDGVWQPYVTSITWPVYPDKPHGTEERIYVQYRDLAGNVSEVYSDSYIVDQQPPKLYVEAEAAPKSVFIRKVTIYAYDELAQVETVEVTNDPLFISDVVRQPFSNQPYQEHQILWTFDDRRVIWVKLKDSVGNWSEPYPAYGGYEPTPSESFPSVVTPSTSITSLPATPTPSPGVTSTGNLSPTTAPISPVSVSSINKEFLIKAKITEEFAKKFWPEAKKEKLTEMDINRQNVVRAVFRETKPPGEIKKITVTTFIHANRVYLVVVYGEDLNLLSLYERIVRSFKILPPG